MAVRSVVTLPRLLLARLTPSLQVWRGDDRYALAVGQVIMVSGVEPYPRLGPTPDPRNLQPFTAGTAGRAGGAREGRRRGARGFPSPTTSHYLLFLGLRTLFPRIWSSRSLADGHACGRESYKMGSGAFLSPAPLYSVVRELRSI